MLCVALTLEAGRCGLASRRGVTLLGGGSSAVARVMSGIALMTALMAAIVPSETILRGLTKGRFGIQHAGCWARGGVIAC